MQSSPSSRRRRTRVACKPCRQNKNRCGMQSPPCARCQRLNIICTIEPCYRRINRRDRVQQLEAQVQELQSILNQEKPGAAGFYHPDMRSADPDAAEESTIAHPAIGSHLRHTEPPAEQETPDEEHQALTSTDYTLGSVRLSVMQAEQLVNIFFEKYHPMLPFLESRTGAEYYGASRLLFWSIIAVSIRNFSTDPSLLIKLTPALSELLWMTITSDPISLALVQALILHSCWPLPNFRFWSDKSPVYANLALMYATHLGLHMPGHEQEYSQKKIPSTNTYIRERSNAWIACKISAQSGSINLGLPPLTPPGEYNFSQARKEDMALDIPPQLKYNLLIQECSFRATQVLLSLREPSSTSTPADTYSKLESIENNFYSLHQSLEKRLSFTNSIRLSGATLLFQCLYFMQDMSQRRRQRKDGVLRAYETAIKLITTAISHDSAHEELLYSPAVIGRFIFLAALVIFRVLHSTYATAATVTGQQPDRNAGQVLYNSACFAIRRCSVQSNDRDFPMRMADLLKVLWRGGDNDVELCSLEPTVKVKSRMGASIVFDCLQIWRGYENAYKDPSREVSCGNSTTRDEPQQQQNPPAWTSSYQPLPFSTLQQGSIGSEEVSDPSLPMCIFDDFMGGGWEEMLNPDWNSLGEFDQNMQYWGL